MVSQLVLRGALPRVSRTFAAIGVIIALFVSCATNKAASKRQAPPASLTIIAVGDNLLHKELINYAAREDGSFDFTPYYTEVRGAVRGADIAFINQETLIAGEEFGYSGYPRFNGPREVGDALIDTGFTVVNHASNHAMDQGEGAVLSVINYWKEKPEIMMLGIHESEAARRTPKLITRKGITIGFLAYTYGLNGIPLPKDKPYLVSLINMDVMAEDIDRLRPLCDVLAVSMHWGNEYEHEPSKRQEELASFLAGRNVDLVIGHHPHVLQPVRFIPKADGGMMLCYFSLGNFISAQNENPRLLGGMMRVTLEKNTLNGAIQIISAELLPLITHYARGHRDFKVYFLDSYTHNMAKSHALNRPNNTVSPDYFLSLVKTIFTGTSAIGSAAGALVLSPEF